MSETRQLPLDLPVVERRGREDWIVSDANRAVTELVDRWPDWPSDVVLVVGPVGSGKSHLAQLLAERSGAVVVAAADLARLDPLALAACPAVVVEDADGTVDETALFHLLNATRQAGSSLMITTPRPLADWGLALPDLVSRLRAATPVALAEPDDALLEALIAKLFADRQTVVDPAVVAYLARRMERSFAVARELVAALDREALAMKGPVGRAVAARVLARDFGRDPHDDQLDEGQEE